MNFLIDECLPFELVEVANSAGHEALFVPYIGKAAEKDWHLALFAIERGMVIVTNNSKDFRGNGKKTGFTTSAEIHPGLVCLNCDPHKRGKALFVKMFKLALNEIDQADEIINTVIEVTQIAEELDVGRYVAPPLF